MLTIVFLVAACIFAAWSIEQTFVSLQAVVPEEKQEAKKESAGLALVAVGLLIFAGLVV